MHFVPNSWSSDGARIAGSLGLGLKAKGIVVFDFGSRTFRQLTDFGEWPVWLPDNQRLLFVAGGDAFYVVDSRSAEVTEVYSVTSDVIGPPRLSTKGELFYSRRVTETEIWLATLE